MVLEIRNAYILCSSLRIVKEKQQAISGSVDRRSGFLKEQLVNIAFCVLSKAIDPNFSQ
jgi:hypothetical protein